MSDIDILKGNLDAFFLVVMGCFVFFMQCGFAFLEAGSVRYINVFLQIVNIHSYLVFIYLYMYGKFSTSDLKTLSTFSPKTWLIRYLPAYLTGPLGGAYHMDEDQVCLLENQISLAITLTRKYIHCGFFNSCSLQLLPLFCQGLSVKGWDSFHTLCIALFSLVSVQSGNKISQFVEI